MAPGAISMAMTRMMPTALQRADDGQRQERQQAVMQQAHRQADGARMLRVEAVQQEIAAVTQHDAQRAAGDRARSRPDRAS